MALSIKKKVFEINAHTLKCWSSRFWIRLPGCWSVNVTKIDHIEHNVLPLNIVCLSVQRKYTYAMPFNVHENLKTVETLDTNIFSSYLCCTYIDIKWIVKRRTQRKESFKFNARLTQFNFSVALIIMAHQIVICWNNNNKEKSHRQRTLRISACIVPTLFSSLEPFTSSNEKHLIIID